MVASTLVEIQFYRGFQRQGGCGSDQEYWENCNSIPVQRYRPSCKPVGVDLLEFAVPEIADVVSGRKKFTTAAKNVKKTNSEKTIG